MNAFFQLPKAQKEILDAWEWYEEQQFGLGDKFKEELASKITDIIKEPHHYPIRGKYREAHMNTFPFLVIFNFDQTKREISIISVFHTRRNPKKKY